MQSVITVLLLRACEDCIIYRQFTQPLQTNSKSVIVVLHIMYPVNGVFISFCFSKQATTLKIISLYHGWRLILPTGGGGN